MVQLISIIFAFLIIHTLFKTREKQVILQEN